jgi:hypothetical protein
MKCIWKAEILDENGPEFLSKFSYSLMQYGALMLV